VTKILRNGGSRASRRFAYIGVTMALTKEEILEAARSLTPAQRYDLIEDLRQILDDEGEFTAEQLSEIRRRVEASDDGEGASIPAEVVVAELREKLRKMRRRRAS
jgi:putative addiction module component (TIGR02574 family)